jgi:hypothetical protein
MWWAMCGAIALGLATLASPASAADIFTFEGKSTVIDGITMAVPNGGEIGSFNTAGEFTMTLADGSKSLSRNICTAMTNQPGEMYALSGFCKVTDDDGHIYGMAFHCNYGNTDQANNICVGSLFGKTGKYQGREGVASWTNIHGELVGSGQWN